MRYRELIDAVLDEIGYAASSQVPQATVQRVGRRLNDWHRRLLTRPTLSRFQREVFTVTFASVASTPTYGLPRAITRISGIRDTTNDTHLVPRDLAWVRQVDPDLTSGGTPEAYIVRGWFPVQTQPSNASTLVVKSSSASDTVAIASVTGLVAHALVTTSVKLNGTTAATVASSVLEVTAFSLNRPAVGTVTLYEDSDAGTALAVIPIGLTQVRHLQVQLWPTPSAANTYAVDGIRELSDLVGDYDEPLLPPEFHDLLVLGAASDEWRRLDDTRHQITRQDLELRLRDLNNWLWNLPEYQPGGEAATRGSQLGPFYPAGS
jgi:hypothetical protein